MITFSCECGKRFQVKDELAGKRAKCSCGKTLVIPQGAAAPPTHSRPANVDSSPEPLRDEERSRPRQHFTRWPMLVGIVAAALFFAAAGAWLFFSDQKRLATNNAVGPAKIADPEKFDETAGSTIQQSVNEDEATKAQMLTAADNEMMEGKLPAPGTLSSPIPKSNHGGEPNRRTFTGGKAKTRSSEFEDVVSKLRKLDFVQQGAPTYSRTDATALGMGKYTDEEIIFVNSRSNQRLRLTLRDDGTFWRPSNGKILSVSCNIDSENNREGILKFAAEISPQLSAALKTKYEEYAAEKTLKASYESTKVSDKYEVVASPIGLTCTWLSKIKTD